MAVKPRQLTPVLTRPGPYHYQMFCQGCHTPDGAGPMPFRR